MSRTGCCSADPGAADFGALGQGAGCDCRGAAKEPDAEQPPASHCVDAPDEQLRTTAHQLAHRFGPKGDVLIRNQTRLDGIFLHSWTGRLRFFFIMYLLFQSIFTWAAPLMDAVEYVLGAWPIWSCP